MRALLEKIARIIKGQDFSIDKDIPLEYLLGVAIHRLVMLLRGKRRMLFSHNRGKRIFLGSRVTLKCLSKIRIGDNATIYDNVYLDALSKNGISIGDGCSIGTGTIIRCSGNFKEIGYGFSMGNNSSLADNCFVGATGGVTIGNDVIGGQNIRFHSSNHIFNDSELLIRKQGVSSKGIRIGNNCWIGAGAVFCDGITIGDGCVIGANAVVTKDFPDNSVIAGVPARIIDRRTVKNNEL